MSQTFSFEIWVPRERLFDAAALIAERDQIGELSSRVWADGRPLLDSADASALTPIRFGVDYNLGFLFPEDEELREFNQHQSQYTRDQNARMWKNWKARTQPQRPGLRDRVKQWLVKREPTPQDLAELPADFAPFILQEQDYSIGDGFYYIYQIETTINGIYEGHEWLDGEEDLILIRFSGGYSDLSHLMSNSPSIRRWFVDLAHEIGAFSCVFDWEGPGKLLYLRGEEFAVNYDDNDVNMSPFGLAGLVGRPQSENARRMSELGRWMWKRDESPSQADELLRAARDANSGIRAKALRALLEWGTPEGGAAIASALDDADARVRELAVYLYTMVEGREIAPVLRLIKTDASVPVRIQATKALGDFPSSLPTLREMLLQTPAPNNLEITEATLDALGQLLYIEQSAAILREVLAIPEFPLRERAQAQLEECAEIQVRLRKNAANLRY